MGLAHLGICIVHQRTLNLNPVILPLVLADRKRYSHRQLLVLLVMAPKFVS